MISGNAARQWVVDIAKFKRPKERQMLALGACGVIEPFTDRETDLIMTARRSVRPRRKQCYANTQRVILRMGEPFRYVEGFVVPSIEIPIAIEHAWLTINGKVVEITMPEPGAAYFGVEIDEETLMEYLREAKVHGSVLNDYETDFKYTKRILQLESVNGTAAP